MITITKGLFMGLAAGLFATACGSDGTGTHAAAGASGTGGSTSIAPGGTGGDTTAGSIGGASGTLGTTGGGGGAGAGPTGTTGVVLDGGFYENGTFKGYLYTAAGDKSTITPPCGTSTCFDTSACVSGVVPKVSSATAFSTEWGALVGWNINQEKMPPNPIGTTSLDGKTIKVTLAPGASALPAGMRVKVAIAGVDYCTPLVGAAMSIPVASLKKQCWTPGGAGVPAGSLVDAVAVQVVSDAAADKKFDFCISALSIE